MERGMVKKRIEGIAARQRGVDVQRIAIDREHLDRHRRKARDAGRKKSIERARLFADSAREIEDHERSTAGPRDRMAAHRLVQHVPEAAQSFGASLGLRLHGITATGLLAMSEINLHACLLEGVSAFFVRRLN